jgi:uncharacterized protein YndB with AHSA1/START domain
MPQAQRVVLISRPVDEVFAFFTDTANDSRWRSHVKEISAASPFGVGTRIHQVVAGPGGRGIPADIEVTDYQPPVRYAFHGVAGPVRPLGEFQFASVDGGTQVSFSLTAKLSGIKKFLMSKPVQKSMDGEMAALDKAKEILEQS